MQEYNGFSEKERLKGDRIIKKAIKEEKLLPMTQAKCGICGQDKGIIQYHCEDYTPENILDDISPLCWHCHQQLHRNKNDNPEKWKQYLKDVKDGVLKPPVYNKRYWTIEKDSEKKFNYDDKELEEYEYNLKSNWLKDILDEMNEL